MKNIIRKVREQDGLSLPELASRSGIDTEILEELENNRAEKINSMILLRISEELKRPIEELFCLN